ncbi:transcriptional adapter b; transcriptional adapte r a; transcriptional adapter [Trichuris trichiura]|uniref:Transcriptional adapter b transcriptional adapte r a transcriptional adapter n=1 Tax=Trichuris trichiura TaxID=36087 RepID=A0A077Z6S3_TRITR|nr:transcriptional adapter b; transcriptional adapte r a; transcriptional adapter [Trichuris trichiura]
MRHRLRAKPASVGSASARKILLPAVRKRRQLHRCVAEERTSLPPFPSVESVDLASSCSILAAVHARSPNDFPLMATELEQMQREVEMILENIVTRYRRLRAFYESLSGKVEVAATRDAASTEQRTDVNGLLKKRQRVEHPSKLPSLSLHSLQENVAGPSTAADSKFSPSSRFCHWSLNQTPDRFWEFVEEYLKTPTDADMAFIRKLLHDSDEEKSSAYYQSFETTDPAGTSGVGDRFPSTWRSHGRLKAQESSAITGEWQLRRRTQSDRVDVKVSDGLRSNSNAASSQVNGYTVSQKCLSATKLVLNYVHHQSDRPVTRRQSVEEGTYCLSYFRARMYKQGFIVAPSSMNDDTAKCNDSLDTSSDDVVREDCNEVVAELLQRQAELRLLQRVNSCSLLRLLKKAEERRRLDAQKLELQQTESSLVELLKKCLSLSQESRDLNKKEQDQLWKLIKDRKKILSATTPS